MSIENIQDSQRKAKELITEEENKLEIIKKIEFEKEKEILIKKLEKNKELTKLKSIIERWLIKLSTIEKVTEGKKLELQEINEILSKIDEIDNIKNINSSLPRELRVNKDEYLEALRNEQRRKEMLSKLDKVLDYVFLAANPFHGSVFDMFSWLIFMLNKNLTIIQENTIDMKDFLIKHNQK